MATSDDRLRRPLRLELLEDRRLLSSVVVNNILDVVNGNTMSIAHLIANNGGDGISLREAILAANSAASEKADEITFDAALSGLTITLGGTALPITEVLTIDARPLAENVTINANLSSRIFNINESAGDVTLGGLTLTGGRTTGSNSIGVNTFSGGAIRSLTSGNLTVDQSTVSGNSTLGARARGGGIYAYGSVTLTQSTVSGNSTQELLAHGGGIFAGSVTLNQSTVSGNSTAGGSSAGGGIYAFSTATLTESTVSGNSTEGPGSAGGGIYAFGSATLMQCTVSGNSTEGNLGSVGGGISSRGVATLTQSTVTGNTTSGGAADGGGIFAGSVTLTECIVSGNRAEANGADGGGIFAAGSAMLARSTVSGNKTMADGARGGGIYAGSATLIQSTVSGNSTLGFLAHGGGIDAGSVTLTQSTVSGNYTSLLLEARGGGIFSRGAVTLTQSTVTRNRSVDFFISSQGGGVYQANTASNHPFSISGSIVAGNRASFGGDDLVKDFESTLTVNFSLIGPFVTPNAGGNNVVADDPQLIGLANNGGPTQTHALLAGSLAINAGDPTIPFNSMQFDQRGAPFVRVFGGRVDIGAFESQTTASANFVPDAVVDAFDFLAWQRGFGATGFAAIHANGNADGDGDVDGDDLSVWKSQFGDPPGASAALSASGDAPASAARPAGQQALSADALFASGDLTGLFASSEQTGRWRRRFGRR